MSELNEKIANLSSAKRAVLNQRLHEKRSGLGNKATVARRTKQGPAPLSFAQERLWFLDQFEPNNAVYNVPVGLRLKGALNGAVLQRCLDEIVRRHEALRTRFETVEAQPVQVIESSASLEMPLTDLSSLPQQQREAEAMRLCREDAQRPFDLKCDLMLRVRLFRFGPTDHILFLNLHHIATDGWSMGVMFTELKTLYAAFVEGKASPLPELPIQYADYAIWQRQWLQGKVLENQLSYWLKQLEAAPERLELPTDRSRPAIQSYRGAMMRGELPNPLATALKELSRTEGATLFMTLLAAFQTLLHRYTGLEDIVVGSAIAGRNLAEVESLIGVFVNTLVLRGDLSGSPTFQTLLHRTREVALAAYAHQDLPFEKLVEVLRPQRDTSHSPLFQVMFVLQNAPTETAQLTNLEVISMPTHTDTSKFDLTLFVREVGESLTANVVYNTDLFDAATISRMLGHYQTLLEGIVAEPEQRILDLPLLDEAEREKILVEWNNTRRVYPTNVCLHELVEARVDRTPDAIAVVCEDESLTYREVNRRANQLAHRLRKLGVGPEVIVGVFAERSVEMVVGLVATLKAGGAYLPLDPNYPADRLNFMLGDARPALVLVQRSLAAKLPQYAGKIVFLEDDFAAESEANPTNRTQPDNLAYVIYTSGSTGWPKGVMNTHRGICNRLLWMQETYQLTTDDRVLQKTPFTFDVSVWEFFWPLLTGARLVVARPSLHGDSQYLIKVICENAITTVHFVPSMLAAFLEDKHAARCSSLRCVICSGEALQFDLQERFFSTLSDTQLHNLYGPTEAAVDVTFWNCERGSGESIVLIGRPVANTQVYILDRTMQPVPPSVTGELHIGGVQLARGYLTRPKLTAEKFVQNPFGEGRLYKTGDLARYRLDGAIEFLGRIDSQVKIRGFRIELGEIETVLRQHPSVQESIVIAREDIPGDKRLVAYVVAREDAPGDERPTANVVSRNGVASPSELRECLRVKLPDYMVPAAFVSLKAVPLTTSGKMDRKALPKPDLEAVADESKFVASSTPTEIVLARIWCEVLGLKHVGVHDNFFELGGHSLLALRIFSEIEKMFGNRPPLASLFQAPTIEKLATVLDDRSWKAVLSPLVAMTTVARRIRQGPAPLSFAQERLWFLDQFEPNNAVYNIPLGLRLKGALNAAVLQRCLDEIVRRHEALRTRFETVETQPVQVIESSASLEMPLTDLSSLPQQQGEAEAMRLCREEAQRFFDLKCDLMLRVRLFRFGPTDHILFLNLHHIATDGWSMGVVFAELKTLYAAFVEGKASPLPELPIQYADYAIWQRQWLQGEVLENQLSYWRKQLDAAPERLELPTDRSRPAIQSYRGAVMRGELPNPLATALKELSRAEGTTLFMTLLAAFQTLLHRYTGLEDIVVGSAIAGRNLAKVESLIGFFVNTLVLRGDLSGNPTFQTLLHRTRQVALAAYAHQDLPFEKLVEALRPQRDTSHSPLFQVMFVLQNAPTETAQLANLEVTSMLIHTDTSKFDLTLFVREVGESLTANVEYNTDLFDAATISKMLGHYQTLLEGIVAEPEQRILDLPLLSEGERHQLLVEWNQTQQDFPRNKCIHEVFEEQVERTPDALAAVFEGNSLSYQELNSWANRLSHHLRALGVGPNVLVGLCVERSFEMIIGLLGILKAGGAYWALEENLPEERLQLMLADARPKVLLFRRNSGKPPPDLSGKSAADSPTVASIEDLLESSPGETTTATSPAQASDPAYVNYTSGSTGQPKGVVVPHRGVVRLVKGTDYASLSAEETLLHLSPLSFDASTFELWGALLNGGRVVVMAPGPPTLAEIGEAIRFHGVTCAWLTAGLFHLMVDERLDDLKPLRQLLAGGDVLSPEHVRKARRALPGCRIINGYGPTENTTFTCCYTVVDERELSPSVPIGRPIANTQVYILDETLQPVPVGVAGELYAGGDGVACGYLHQPRLTAQKFVPDPFSGHAGARLYRTGDRARWRTDGNIEYLGRLDHQVKIRGFRVELGEIEEVLDQHPGVQTSVVVAREDTPGDKRLTAYVVTPNGAHSPSELSECLRVKLPDYMVPAAFVTLQALPLTPNGKVDRKALPKPDFEAVADKSKFLAPSTPTEIVLARIWCEVLGLKHVGIHDNFFELGGHSLLAVRIFSKIEKMFGDRPPLATLFQAPTIERLAICLEDRSWKRSLSPLVAIQPCGSLPPFFGVHGGYGDVMFYSELTRCLGKNQPFYALQAKGLEGCEMRYTSIEAIASYYLEEIRQVQARGPYFLGGYCTGGIIALEMAQQLRAAGEEVAFLVLFDTSNPERPVRHSTIRKRIRMALDEASGLSPGEKLRYFARRVAYRLKWEAGKVQKAGYTLLELLYKTRKPGGENIDGGLLPLKLPVWITLQRAMRKYKPRAYPGRIVLFRPTVSDGYEYSADRGWTEVAEGGLEIHDIEGKHGTIFERRHVAAGAEKLAARIRAALSRLT